jgi:hypothetical protein
MRSWSLPTESTCRLGCSGEVKRLWVWPPGDGSRSVGQRGLRENHRWVKKKTAPAPHSKRVNYLYDPFPQYSSGNSTVVADRSASVMIHSFSPATVV